MHTQVPDTPVRSPQALHGFTLIEVMVLITIIVVLMALLVPALNNALYQAKLAACASNFKVVAGSAVFYAMDNRRFYPKRNEEYRRNALRIRAEHNPFWGSFDLRPLFLRYMPLESFLDPLLGGVDLSDSANGPLTHLYANFNIYTGLPRGEPDWKVMNRYGQGFEFHDTKSPGGPTEHLFTVIASDRDTYFNGPNFWSASSHPSMVEDLNFYHRQDSTADSPSWPFTMSQWSRPGAASRPVDLNYAYDDNSVRRFDGVVRDDERMAKVSATTLNEYQPGSATNGKIEHLPKQPR